MYAAFSDRADPAPFEVRAAEVDVDAKTSPKAYGGGGSARMNFADIDDAPMHRLNAIIWKSVRGAASPMPPSVHRYRAVTDH